MLKGRVTGIFLRDELRIRKARSVQTAALSMTLSLEAEKLGCIQTVRIWIAHLRTSAAASWSFFVTMELFGRAMVTRFEH